MKKLLIYFFLFSSLAINAQSIDKIWYSEISNTCLEFDTTRNLMNMSAEYDSFDSNWKKRIEYEIHDSILTIKWYNNQSWIGFYTADKTKWKIVMLSESKFILSHLKGEKPETFEVMGGKELEFEPRNYKTCQEVYNALKTR